jgi:hypothetical protein
LADFLIHTQFLPRGWDHCLHFFGLPSHGANKRGSGDSRTLTEAGSKKAYHQQLCQAESSQPQRIRRSGLGARNLAPGESGQGTNSIIIFTADHGEMNNLANPDNPNYDEELLSGMNTKLNSLIQVEIGEDKLPFERIKSD